jgi:hypothetical protein
MRRCIVSVHVRSGTLPRVPSSGSWPGNRTASPEGKRGRQVVLQAPDSEAFRIPPLFDGHFLKPIDQPALAAFLSQIDCTPRA